MNKANHNQKNIRPRQVLLYRNVFYSRVSTTVVLLLCASFLLQPIERVFASDVSNGVSEDTTIVNLAVDAGLSPTTDPTVQPQEVLESEVAKNIIAEPLPESTINPPTPVFETNTDDVSTSTPPEVSTDGSVIGQVGSVADEISSTTTFTAEEIQALINPEDKLPTTEIASSTPVATTTPEIPIAVTTVNSDAVMQFNRNDCVTVEDGSFYCQAKKEEVTQGTDGMYALQDKDGDLEIFLQKDGVLSQLTFNTVDDAAPMFDAKSNTIVWHRLVNERYQIISFDLNTKEEVQLTADNVNNMEPSRSGNYTVWQRWNDTNWDIVLYDGTETKFITDSTLNDIAPKVNGDLIMWNRLALDKTQTIELYNITTKEYTTITDEEGGALSNPRMVLVYETQFANGDVVTKGYDVATGEVTPLANNPAELPEKLPEPDATGETRALIQPKNPTKEDTEVSDNIFPAGNNAPGGASTSSASTTTSLQPGDLHVASSSSTIAGSTPNVATSSQTISDLTLDLTPTVSLNPDLPPDLVVPVFVPETSVGDVVTTQ